LKSTSKYIIPIKGLKEGVHKFEFMAEKTFFEEKNFVDINHGSYKIDIIMNKTGGLMILEFNISGFVNLMCDRCLEYFNLPTEFNGSLYIRYNDDPDYKTDTFKADDLMILSPEKNEIDLSQYIYESIRLSIPYKRIHPENEKGDSDCNELMLSKLRELNNSDGEEDTDPRWDKLKSINLKTN